MRRSVMFVCLVVTAGLAASVLATPASASLYLSKLSFVDASCGWASCTSSDGLQSYCVARTTDGGATSHDLIELVETEETEC